MPANASDNSYCICSSVTAIAQGQELNQWSVTCEKDVLHLSPNVGGHIMVTHTRGRHTMMMISLTLDGSWPLEKSVSVKSQRTVKTEVLVLHLNHKIVRTVEAVATDTLEIRDTLLASPVTLPLSMCVSRPPVCLFACFASGMSVAVG